MTAHQDRDETDLPDRTAAAVDEDTRYAELETPATVIVYDRENHRAWLQSDAAVAVADCR